MGNTQPFTRPPSLAMVAVARKLGLQRFQVVVLRETLAAFADYEGYVDKESFNQALMRAKITDQDDIEIFDLLFTMWDGEGNEKIPCRPFSVGISPLACSHDEIISVLLFALHVSDEKSSGIIDAQELHDLLNSIDITASYFGDARLQPADINSVVEAVFDKRYCKIPHELCARKLRANAYVKRFISGKTRSRVQFKKELALATEFSERDPVEEESDCTSPVAILGTIIRDNMWFLEVDQCGPCSPIEIIRKGSLLVSSGSCESAASGMDSLLQSFPLRQVRL